MGITDDLVKQTQEKWEAEKLGAGLKLEQFEMEAGLNSEGLTLTGPHIVKVQYYSETTGELSAREYTYYSSDRLNVGDIVIVPVRDTTGKAKVSAIDVPEAEIAVFKDKVKTIPTRIENTKINLCDTCSRRKDYPICTSPDVAFGDGQGNDNIIQCGNYYEGEAKPCTIPFNVEIQPTSLVEAVKIAAEAAGVEVKEVNLTAITLRTGEDLEVRGHYATAIKLLEYAKAMTINTLEDSKMAVSDLATIGTCKRAMETKRKEYLEPYQNTVKDIQAVYKELMAPVLEAEEVLKAKQIIFLNEQKRRQQEQERINQRRYEAAQAEMALKGELTEPVNLVEVIEAPKLVRGVAGTSGMVERWKYEVVDLLQVPREYLIVDHAMLASIAKTHHDKKTIAGVHFFNDPYLATRR